ncbi:fructokinase-like 1, chloroplastic [Humulus lupulus]|uniref:fructokinase-like 1, chloroplastic n=1 Tax=Humulus lupulus TaxID=3486 RepID=UPI002B40204B|nr:fructokinase-like 1, chloroplastic [Humulus lupulus]XP_062095364.1 fructokinase-like 1, chloroplastic [Humulus lupulus]XP_062095365.1 fructokinase-like 1, chloroplastic [Humulus lupulus]XP_062095366.1 fructokinase-like 1, chloroplastic [Humulus lupulus]
MASFHLLPPSFALAHHKLSSPLLFQNNFQLFDLHSSLQLFKSHKLNPIRASTGDDANGAIQTKQPSRRGRKKGSTSSPSSSSESSTKKTRRSRKSQAENDQVSDSELEDYDDGMDIPYDDPPLICCFGAAQKEFVPTVRVSDNPMDPDIYSEWKMLQWDPPEFVRAPGGPPSNVAISHVRLGGRAAFMGKVGEDDFGEELVLMMNQEKVQTRAVKFDSKARTACTYMKIKFKDGKMRAEVVKESAEDSLLSSELNLSVLKEARIFHFNSEVLTSSPMQRTLFKAISYSKKFGGLVFFDPNLPLPLWRSRDETWEFIKRAWNEANIIEVSRQELEFLLDEDYYERKRNYRPQYYSENFEQTKNRKDHHHYTREEISPLWHDGLKFLFVTDGTLRIHFYSPSFDGVIAGTEDVLITPFTCDRTGSGDAVVAAIMRKLTTCPEMYENEDILERELRFAVAAGIISQWTIGAVRGFPTESATQNLKEQVYVPSMW